MMSFPYDPKTLKRELKRFYISASEEEQNEMLKACNLTEISEVFSHIKPEVMFTKPINPGPEMDYYELAEHMLEISKKNILNKSYLGDGLKHYSLSPVLGDICAIRGLTTAYTPYQPERSQGTLTTLWIYASALSELTGFEAINASLYERSTCLFEAIKTAGKVNRKKGKALIVDDLYPGDKEVLLTMAEHTGIEFDFFPIDKTTGKVNIEDITNFLKTNSDSFSTLVFSQVNCFGVISDFNDLTDLATEYQLKSVAIIDPAHLGSKGLKKPAHFGSDNQGCDIIVGEGQHLCLGLNFGGPGLGIFGVRYNEKDKLTIRQTPGRYIGDAKDSKGRTCKAIILSTREQHIRRDKATSNICSNQSFVASLAGASMLMKGDDGFNESFETSRRFAKNAVNQLTSLEGVDIAFDSAFVNEVVFKISGVELDELIERGNKKGVDIGVNISDRVDDGNQYLLTFFTDKHSEKFLVDFFKSEFKATNQTVDAKEIPPCQVNTSLMELPKYKEEEVLKYYQQLGNQNVSPDDAIYPLGSCTMKYNPYINDYTASYKCFTEIHPQTNVKNAQGCMQVLYEIQEQFKEITGLPGVTTQPVAGAQGELVGIKLFQGYFKDKGENRNIVLIPKSAHGTNPATATYAGCKIVLVGAQDNGLIDLEDVKTKIAEHGRNILGIMITNPNTSGVFEDNFKEVADCLHAIDAFVYMDGANMNAIAGWVDLGKLGVDAVHNNLHKTWTIPHGGGGPGDAIVAVSEKLIDFLPGVQITKTGKYYETIKPKKSIGSFHRHFGNFAHKVRALTYLKRLGGEGIRQMSAFSVLSSRYLFERLKKSYASLPINDERPKMHEFILTLDDETFKTIEAAGIQKAQIIGRIGKLFLDFGLHAPTVAFPEQYGLMVEPTESFTKSELDHFAEVVESIMEILKASPQVLHTVPHFTPIDRVDELAANKTPVLRGSLVNLPEIIENRVNPGELMKMDLSKLQNQIVETHQSL